MDGIADNPLFKSYAFYTSILVLKMLVMSPLTSRQRFIKNIFANPEDGSYFGESKSVKIVFNDPDVERVRRAHLNDLENIPIFMVVSAIYMTTRPEAWLANILMMSYTLARISHSIVYAVIPMPQPSRAIAWGVGIAITAYMAISNVLFFLK